MANSILVNVNRCVGCWTCSMACKMQHQLDDDDFRIVVRTHGSGAGIGGAVYCDAVVTIDGGEITAVGAGTTRIRADAEGGARAAMRVRVEAALPPSVGLAVTPGCFSISAMMSSRIR